MNTSRIPYEIIEKTFGTLIENNFDTIISILAVIGFTVAIFSSRTRRKKWVKKRKNIQLKNKKQKFDGYQGNQKEGITWYPTGWTYSKKTGLWEPPNFKPPTKQPSFEEWKAKQEKENSKK